MDAPRRLFDQIVHGGFAEMQRMVDERYQEDLYLDFKVLQAGEAPMKTEDKKTYAESVSGFANSDGGIIIWGIYATKDRDGIDSAQEFRPIQHLRRFMTDLHSLLPQLVVPGVAGVTHHAIAHPDSHDMGYVVTLVPKGEREPHMARGQGQHRYYYRCADSFLIMEPFMLADRFGRRPQPRIRLARRYEVSDTTIYLVLGLENVGQGCALFPGLRIQRPVGTFSTGLAPLNPSTYQFTRDSGFGLPERKHTDLVSDWRMFAGGADHVIHPGTVMDILRVPFTIEEVRKDPFFTIRINYSLHCDGFTQTHCALIFSGYDVLSRRSPEDAERESYAWSGNEQ